MAVLAYPQAGTTARIFFGILGWDNNRPTADEKKSSRNSLTVFLTSDRIGAAAQVSLRHGRPKPQYLQDTGYRNKR
jgi:hypothetical protein